MLKDDRVKKFARVGKIKQRKSRKKIERNQKYSEARNDVTGADVDRKIPFRFFSQCSVSIGIVDKVRQLIHF